jgi:multiple sugar transport system ATP-binding protein
VRPEDLEVTGVQGDGLAVVVDLVEELGADGYLYGHSDISGRRTDIVARVDGRSHPEVGETVFLHPAQNHTHVFDVESGARLSAAVTA